MEQELTSKGVYCSRCGAKFGNAVDNTYLEIGSARIWYEMRFTCAKCDKPKFWRPDESQSVSGFEGETKEVLNGLGLKNKWVKQRQPRSLKGKKEDVNKC